MFLSGVALNVNKDKRKQKRLHKSYHVEFNRNLSGSLEAAICGNSNGGMGMTNVNSS
jgi:hypothetical protein